MGIFADVQLPGGMTICKVYISPRYISANRDVGHYALDYLSQQGGAALPIPPDFSIIEFKAAGREQPGDNPLRRSGAVYDRDKPAHGQVYADLREKLKAGQVPWLTNVRNEDGSPFVDRTAALAASVPEPDTHNFPAPSDKLSDWDVVAEDALTTADLTEETIQKITKAKRKKFTELLNVELAELQQERSGPREDLKRENEIEALLGLFARVGEI